MKSKRLVWLMVVLGSVMLFAGLARASRPSAQACELTGNTANLPLVHPGTQSVALSPLTHTADITFTPAYTAYLPSVSNFYTPPLAGIYGHVTYQGVPMDAVEIRLQLWTHYASGWQSSSSDDRYTTTGVSGLYQFTTAASLGTDKRYTVQFRNTANDARFISTWRCSGIYTYTAGQVLAGGDIELANMVYLSPANNANVGLPVVFRWQPRVGAPTDNYMFELHMLADPWGVFQSPRLGYSGTYTLTTLPAGFTTGTQYGWYIWIFGPGESVGYTNQYGSVTFH